MLLFVVRSNLYNIMWEHTHYGALGHFKYLYGLGYQISPCSM